MEKNDMLEAMQTLGQAISHLISLTEKLSEDVESLKQNKSQITNEWLTLEQLQNFIPTHPSARTIYGWVKSNKIPYHKLLGSLLFKRDEIDQWIILGKSESLNYG